MKSRLGTFLLILLILFVALWATDSDKWFNCGGSTNIKIPREYFDDDYCDCMETGNDEPFTSACNNGRFWCTSDHKYIPSSSVNDGICDCSDGADESSTNGKCDKYNHKIQHMQRNFHLLAKTINNIHHIYEHISFPNYITSMFTTQEIDPNNYRNMKDVHRFLRQKRNKKQYTKPQQNTDSKLSKGHKEDFFPYNDKYKPPNKEKESTLITVTTDDSSSWFGGFFMFMIAMIASLASIAYYVGLKYFDKSKQN